MSKKAEHKGYEEQRKNGNYFINDTHNAIGVEIELIDRNIIK